MPAKRLTCDASIIIGTILAFCLPMTLMIPDFSIWDVVPKIRVIRFLIVVQHLTWSQLNVAIVSVLTLFFCLYLEIRKRKMDDMVENVLTISQATDKAMEIERERQTAAVRVCVKLLDASAEHYENLVLLRDDLRKRSLKHHPPAIEPSYSYM